jgi:hypothetical protein
LTHSFYKRIDHIGKMTKMNMSTFHMIQYLTEYFYIPYDRISYGVFLSFGFKFGLTLLEGVWPLFAGPAVGGEVGAAESRHVSVLKVLELHAE